MVEGETVVDDVVGPHAEAVVHQGSHAVIPGRAEGQGLGGPLERQEEWLRGPTIPRPPPRATSPYLLCTTMAALGSPVVPDV